MTRKKTETAAPETVQEGREPQEMTRDTQEAETAPETAEAPQEGSAQEIIGPEGESELLGCQEEGGARDDPPLEYAVAGCGFLNLRKRPGLNAPVIAALPRGVGVSFEDAAVSQADGHWWLVSTGRLIGWVMSQYLEPVWS